MFDYGNMESYTNNWDWCKERSNYHFDYNKKDAEGEWFTLLGQFQGNWDEEIKQVVELSRESAAINWETRKFYGDDDDTISPMLKQEEQDLIDAGADPKLALTNIFDKLEKFPTLDRIANYFQLEESKRRIHVQMTGQMFNWHIDKLWERCPEDPSRVVRITIMLEDWLPGQFYLYGTHTYSHWKRGEVHLFDWPNVPHATANASNTPRPTLQITGLKTAATEEILKSAGRSAIYKV